MQPIYGRVAGRRGELTAMRLAAAAFAMSVPLYGIVLLFLGLETSKEGMSPLVGVAIVVGVGFATSVAAVLPVRLDCSSNEALGRSYRSRFFVRVALSEVSALIGFVFAFVVGTPLMYAVSVPFVAFGLARAAPTAGRIDRDQDELNSSGCALSLRQALETPAAS